MLQADSVVVQLLVQVVQETLNSTHKDSISLEIEHVRVSLYILACLFVFFFSSFSTFLHPFFFKRIPGAGAAKTNRIKAVRDCPGDVPCNTHFDSSIGFKIMRKEVGIYNKLARIYDRKTILPAWIIFDPPEGYMYTQ